MSATVDLFEEWKKAKGFTSDRAAGHALKVSPQAVNNWRTRDGNAEAHVIERMANDLGRDPIPYILQAFSEAAKDAEARRTLAKMAKKLAANSMALLLALMPYFAPTNADANESGSARYIHYAHLAMRKILAALGALPGFLSARPPRLQPSRMEPQTWTLHPLASCATKP